MKKFKDMGKWIVVVTLAAMLLTGSVPEVAFAAGEEAQTPQTQEEQKQSAQPGTLEADAAGGSGGADSGVLAEYSEGMAKEGAAAGDVSESNAEAGKSPGAESGDAGSGADAADGKNGSGSFGNDAAVGNASGNNEDPGADLSGDSSDGAEKSDSEIVSEAVAEEDGEEPLALANAAPVRMDAMGNSGVVEVSTWSELQAELDKAGTDSQDSTTIKLTRDYVSAADDPGLTITIPDGKHVTLDLNNHYILYKGDANASVISVNSGNSGALTLTDSTDPAGDSTAPDERTPRYVTLTSSRGTAVLDSQPNTGTEGTNYLTVIGGFLAGGTGTMLYGQYSGGGVYLGGGTLTISGGSILGCIAQYGGGVCLEHGNFSMEGGTITNCAAYRTALQGGYGGAVYAYGECCTMEGGTIKDCTAKIHGGALYVGYNCTFTMKGGTIQECTAEQTGGAVYTIKSFTMEDGTIEDCTAANGGAVYAEDTCTFTMRGGTINRCKASVDGGAVYVRKENKSGVFEMQAGAKISGCSASGNGGGVYTAGEFRMNKGSISGASYGEITGCTAANGGGVYASGKFSMSYGRIYGNNASKANGAGGVYAAEGSDFSVSDTPRIDSNFNGGTKDASGEYTAGSGGKAGNVGLAVGVYITIDGALSSPGILYVSGAKNQVIAVKKDASGNYETPGTADIAAFVSDDETHVIAAGTYTDDDHMTHPALQLLHGRESLQEKFNNASTDQTAPTTITLDCDYIFGTDGQNLTVPKEKTVTLDLNGHYILLKGSNKSVFQVKGILTLTDSAAEDKKTTRYVKLDNTGRGTEVSSSQPSGTEGTDYLEISGGFITGGSAENGGGVCISEGGKFTLDGGTICGCTAEKSGGGVYDGQGTFTIKGGEIYRCTAESGGGAGVEGNRNGFYMYGGTIRGCVSTNTDETKPGGGGVCISGSSDRFQMIASPDKSAVITGCASGTYGGGVFVGSGNSFTMYTEKRLEMRGSAVITGCNSEKGGGVYVQEGCSFEVKESPVIKDNFKGGTKNDTTGRYEAGTSGKASNIMLAEGVYITIISDLRDSNLNVSGAKDQVIAVKEDWNNNIVAPASDLGAFVSDDEYLEIAAGTDSSGNPAIQLVSSWALLQAEFDAASEDPQNPTTIRLTKDYISDPDEEGLRIPAGKYITLDLSDHCILYKGNAESSVISVMAGGHLTLQDSAADDNKTIRYVTLEGGRGTEVSTTVPENGTLGTDYLQVTGGLIAGGYATGNSPFGGGVCVDNVNNDIGEFTMEGGTITGCIAQYGGGVYVDGDFTMTGGAITGCNVSGADSKGGGVYVAAGGAFKVSGTPVISGNKQGSNANNVSFCDDVHSTKTIAVTGPLTGNAGFGVSGRKGDAVAEGTTGYSLTAGDAERFSPDDSSLMAVLDGGKIVLKKPVTVSISATPRKYVKDKVDVELDASTAVFSGTDEGAKVSVDLNRASAVMENANAGENKPVSVTGLTLTGADAGKYLLTGQPENVTVTIEQEDAPTLQDIEQNLYYKTTGDILYAMSAGVMPADAGDVMFSVDTNERSVEKKEPGNTTVISSFNILNSDYTVCFSFRDGCVGDKLILPVKIFSDNYKESAVRLVYTLVDKYPAQVSVSGTGVSASGETGTGTSLFTKTVTYGSPVFTLSAEAGVPGTGEKHWIWSVPEGSEVAEIQNGASSASAVIGVKKTGTAKLKVHYESDTHMGDAELTLTVAPKSVTITGVTVSNKEYDRTTTATITNAGSVVGAITGDDVRAVAGTARFADKNTGSQAVSFTGFTLGGTAAGNYTLSDQPSDITASITPKPATVKVTAANRTYERGNRTVALSASLSGVLSGDKVTLDKSAMKGEVGDPNAKNDKEVTVSGISLAGEDAGNYELKGLSDVKVTIRQATFDGASSFEPGNRTFLYSEEASESMDLSGYLPEDSGEVTWGVPVKSGSFTYQKEPAVSGGLLSYTLEEASGDASGTVRVTAKTQNYTNSFNFTVNIRQVALALYEKSGNSYEARSDKELTIDKSFTLLPMFANKEILNHRVVWESSNPDVATVTQDGKVTGKSTGTVTIKVTSEENPKLTASCRVTVTEPVTEISLNRTSYSFGAGESFKLSAQVLPLTATQSLIWQTNNSAVAVVCDEYGEELTKETDNGKQRTYKETGLQTVVIKAKSAGNAVITAGAADGSGKRAACSLTVGKAVPSFTIAARGNVKNLAAGKNLTLSANWGRRAPRNTGLSWTVTKPDGSDASGIATISDRGVLTGLTEGVIRVTATSTANPERSASTEITVYVPVKSVTLNTTSGTVSKKSGSNGLQLFVEVLSTIDGARATGTTLGAKATVTYSVDKKYAQNLTVSQMGLVQAGSKTGNNIPVTVTVKAYNGYQKVLTCRVNVKEENALKGIKLNKTSLTLGEGNKAVLTATLNPLNPDGKTGMTFTTSDPEIVTVDQKGNLVGKKAGSATITVTAEGTVKSGRKEVQPTATCKVTVSPSIKEIIFTNAEALKSTGLACGKSYTLKTQLTLTGSGRAASAALLWESSDSSVATVSTNGAVKALLPGTVTITATAKDDKAGNEKPPFTKVEFTTYAAVTGIKLDKTKLTLGTKEESRYGIVSIARVLPENATDPSIAWTVNNRNVVLAAIDPGNSASTAGFANEGAGVTTKAGQVLAVKALIPGTAKLTGTTTDGSKKKVTCTVTIRGEVTGLWLKSVPARNEYNDVTVIKEASASTDGTGDRNSTYQGTMKPGTSLKLTALPAINGVTYAEDTRTFNAYKQYTDISVSYRSSNTSVATVDKNGRITIKKKALMGADGQVLQSVPVTIFAASADGKQTAEYRITVE